ncbi:hypothetical protein WJR50_14420 [Catalinimonas sp. 4WD22]|uniref:hypothetical protein n=1 Tax=Catalinimonas locisalis TaxID=3133978 RepID=UPI003100B2A3
MKSCVDLSRLKIYYLLLVASETRLGKSVNTEHEFDIHWPAIRPTFGLRTLSRGFWVGRQE